MTNCPTAKSYSARDPVPILGVPFDKITMAEALAAIEDMIASGESHYIVTPNVDFVVQAQTDVELRRILFDADLVICDGTPLVWGSRLLGSPLPERVAGSDLVPLLIHRAARRRYRLFLLGAAPGAATLAARRLRQQYPGLTVEYHAPPIQPLLGMNHDEIARRVRDARPDILLVAFGCPKQEKWIAMHLRSLGVPVAIGVGATVDFLAGYMKRAPVWMQRTGTEWIFRLLQEPRRLFKRYARDLWLFSWKFLAQYRQLRRSHRRHSHNAVATTLEHHDCWLLITAPPCLHGAATTEIAPLEQGPSAECHCAVDVSHVRSIDTAGLGWLVRLQKSLRRTGRELVLIAPTKKMQRTIGLLGYNDFFHTAPDFAVAKQLVQTLSAERRQPAESREPSIIESGPVPDLLASRQT